MKNRLVLARTLLVTASMSLAGCARQSQRVIPLEDQINLEVTGCTDNGASGTVFNESDDTVPVFFHVQYTDDDGGVAGDGLGYFGELRSGEIGQWEDQRIDDHDISRCQATVITEEEFFSKPFKRQG